MRFLTIRWKLTLAFGLALVVLLGALGITVYLAFEQRLLKRTDTVLDEELYELGLELQLADSIAELREELNERFAMHETFDFQVFGKDDLIFSSRRLRDFQLPVSDLGRNDETTQYTTIENAALGPCRVAIRWERAFDQDLRLQVVTRLKTNQEELADFAQILWVVGPIGVLSAMTAGYYLSKRALAAVDQMTMTAEQITATNLSGRINATNTDDELGRLARTINRMLDRLQEAVEDQRRFTGDAAHELRTPLAVLRTEVEVALRSHRTTESYVETLQTVLEEIVRLSRLSSQLLTLSRHDAGIATVSHETVEISAIIRDVVEQLATFADSKGVDLSIDEIDTASVCGDDLQLSQLVFNLTENGIKYTSRGGRVRISGHVDGKLVIIVVKDNGTGIPGDSLPKVFQRFYRVETSRSRDLGGTGLGLSICEAIVRSHGGTIHIESEIGAGTSVTVRLPVSED